MRRQILVPLVSMTVLVWPAAASVSADVPTCLGKPATIVGTAGDDDLKGTNGPDVIWAGPGYNETVHGYGGNDLICLGEATDVSPGEDDSEEMADGGDGNDKIVGGRGLNTVLGGYGNDEIWAISDAAYVYEYETGADYYRGGPGNDVLHGGQAGESMYGGRGNDAIDLGDALGDGYDAGENWGRGGGDGCLIDARSVMNTLVRAVLRSRSGPLDVAHVLRCADGCRSGTA